MAKDIAVVHKDPECDSGVSFPDFPGCFAIGDNIDEAKNMAQDAFALHIQGMLEDGEQLPTASKLEDIMAEPDVSNAAAFLVIGVPDTNPRTIRVNITVPEMTLKQIYMAANTRQVPLVISRTRRSKRRS